MRAGGVLLADGPDGKSPAVIKGSPAELAGLRKGDIIPSINGEELTIKKGLADVVSEYQPGAELKLVVMRAGKQIQILLVLK